MTKAHDFAEIWRGGMPRSLPSRVEAAFVKTLNWMQTQHHMDGFTEGNEAPELDEDTPYSFAKQFYWYFQTHLVKAQFSLLTLSDELVRHGETSWLDEPCLCVMDIGSGTGAGTFALLDLMCQYQEYCWDTSSATWPRTIDIAAVDPSRHGMQILLHFLELLRPELAIHQITVRLVPIRGSFPDGKCLDTIVARWHLTRPRVLMAIASNVIRPIQNSWDRFQALFQRAGLSEPLHLGDAVAAAYDELLDHYGFGRVRFVDIATGNRTNRDASLADALRIAWRRILGFFGERGTYTWHRTVQAVELQFWDSPHSHYGLRGEDNATPTRTSYHHEIHHGSRLSDEELRADLSPLSAENLQLAWARARNFMLSHDWVDEIEIRLADRSHDTYLSRLRLFVSEADMRYLAVGHRLPFWSPKKSQADRPRYMMRLGEQIMAAAVSQCKPDAFQPIDIEHILGNRLSRQRNEFFYEPWFTQYRAYLTAIQRAAPHDQVVTKFDIKSHYTNIVQHELYRVLKQALDLRSRSALIPPLTSIVLQHLGPPHRRGKGLPQISIVGGLWSNKHLDSLDRQVLRNGPERAFYRYADDIAVISEPSSVRDIERAITTALLPLGLELNPNKTRHYRASTYSTSIMADPRCDQLVRQTWRLLDAIYYVPREYRRALSNAGDAFLTNYEVLLRELGINLPSSWLSRKMRSRLSSIRSILNNLRWGQRMRFPPLPAGMRPAERREWARQFIRDNPVWDANRENLITALVQLFADSLEAHDGSSTHELGQASARRSLRFAVNRLAVLGIRPIADSVESILRDRPWLISARSLLKALIVADQQEAVLRLARRWRSNRAGESDTHQRRALSVLRSHYYLSAAACWALGHARHNRRDIVQFLWGVLKSPTSDTIERLAASEALIRLDAPTSGREGDLRVLATRHRDSPYLLKNMVLLLGSTHRGRQSNLMRSIIRAHGQHHIVVDAAQFAAAGRGNILRTPEPEIIQGFYARRYPTLPMEIIEDYRSVAL